MKVLTALVVPTFWLPKARLVGLAVTVVSAEVAVPDRVTSWASSMRCR